MKSFKNIFELCLIIFKIRGNLSFRACSCMIEDDCKKRWVTSSFSIGFDKDCEMSDKWLKCECIVITKLDTSPTQHETTRTRRQKSAYPTMDHCATSLDPSPARRRKPASRIPSRIWFRSWTALACTPHKRTCPARKICCISLERRKRRTISLCKSSIN